MVSLQFDYFTDYVIGVFVMCSSFPPIYTQAVMSGQGLAGVAVSVLQIVSLLSGASASPEEQSTFDVNLFL